MRLCVQMYVYTYMGVHANFGGKNNIFLKSYSFL